VSFAQQKKGADLSTLKLIMSGGDRFPWQLVSDYTALTGGAHFFNVYGPTEVTINCFAVRLDNKLHLADAGKAVPIGECFDTMDHVLLDESGMPANEGELCVTGPQLMFGYHSDPSRTEAAFVSDPRVDYVKRPLYRTGDVGFRDGGLMYLKGRVDGLIKIRGYRIHPDEVSKALDTLDGVDISAVVSFGNQSNAALAAFIKLKPNSKLSPESITVALKELIPSYMIPSRYEFVEKFPLNQSGKIDKKALSRSLV
jgi:acyl-CoA synthetase (AMP-forming)/AMP-acid ligase II